MQTTPPRSAERLLQWCLRSAPAAECIVGDLRQEYDDLRVRRGAVLAYLWYWKETVAVGARYLVGGSPEVGRWRPSRPQGPTPSLARDIGSELTGAFRVFRTSTGFALAVVLTLALGIGANVTMFGAVDRILLSPPEHVQDHEELRFLLLDGLGDRSINAPEAYSFPDYLAIADLPVLESAAAYRPRRNELMGSGPDARSVILQSTTWEFFPLLGVVPERGRFYDADDDGAGAPPVAVISHGFWRSEFGQDPEVIGRTVAIGSHTYEVIGVAPRGFTGAEIQSVDLWVPTRMNMELSTSWAAIESRGAWWFRVIVRLADGVTDEQAEARMSAAHTVSENAWLESGQEATSDMVGGSVRTGAFMTALGPKATTNSRITLWLAGVSLLVLLIACANVANLMLARGLDRQRERAVRLAFGVSRRRLISQALAESALLATVGGIAALVVANWTGRALYGILLPGVPLPDATVNLRLVGFLGLIVFMTTLVAGMLPAVQALRTAPGDVLRTSRLGATSGGRARGALTVGQVSVSTILLIGAGFFVQSLRNATEVDLGFDHASVLNVDLRLQGGVDSERHDQLVREAQRLLDGMPGVESVIISTDSRPLYGWNEQSRLRPSRIDSLPPLAAGGPFTYAATEGYIETAGIRVIRGRGFGPDDFVSGAPYALMVSRSFAEGAWPGLDPLQECITLDHGPVELDGPEPCRPIVGVYEDMMVRSLADQGIWSVTWPLPPEARGMRGILIRAEGDPMELAQPIRDRLVAMSSDVRWVSVLPMISRVESLQGPWRIGATLFTAFGLLALLVASLGLYSVLAFVVARQSREIGIRAALGAQRRELVAMVLVRAGRLVGFGLVVGIAVAAFAGRFLESLLFGVPTVNPIVFGGVAVMFAGAGLIAAWIPAWKATSIDPVGAMAAE